MSSITISHLSRIIYFFISPPTRGYLHSFPTRRSSDLSSCVRRTSRQHFLKSTRGGGRSRHCSGVLRRAASAWKRRTSPTPDRKSTRLNSSHRCISYDVFCLKKKIKYKVEPSVGRYEIK